MRGIGRWLPLLLVAVAAACAAPSAPTDDAIGVAQFAKGGGPDCNKFTGRSYDALPGPCQRQCDAEPGLPWCPPIQPPPPANEDPVAAFVSVCTELHCDFDASGSHDNDGTIAAYGWTFGDGSTGSGQKPGHDYAADGTYTVNLTVTDNNGATNSIAHSVTVAATPPPPPPPPSGDCDVTLTADNLAATLAAQPTGATICVPAGTFTASSISPKAGQTILCSGSVLHGTGTAFRGGGPATIDGCVIEGYDPRDIGYGLDAGAIHGDGTSGWIIQNVEARNNAGVGIRSGDDWKILNNHLHHNGNLGLGGYMADRFVAEGNEIDHNGFAGRSGEHGGTKFVDSHGGTMRDNSVHDNEGRGIWFDTEIFNVTVDGNEVYGNSYEGIWLENVCGPGTIVNNYSHDNGTGDLSGWIDRANIQIVNGQDIEIAYNRTGGGQHQISILAVGGYPTYSCVPAIKNVTVHDNAVTLDKGAVGMMTYSYAGGYDQVSFYANTYTITNGWFAWNGLAYLSYSQWKQYHPDD